MTHVIARDDLVPPPARTSVAAVDVVRPVLDLGAVALGAVAVRSDGPRRRIASCGVMGASDLAPVIRVPPPRAAPALRTRGNAFAFAVALDDAAAGWPVRALFLVAVLLFLVLAAFREDIGYAVYDVHEVPAPTIPGAVIV